MDQTRKQAKLEFDACTARSSAPTVAAGTILAPCSISLQSASLPSRSVARRWSSSMAVEYAKVRVQFGRPIGSFQAIKHKCADMLLEVESAKSAAYYGCGAPRDERRACLDGVARQGLLLEAYFHAAAENIQIHGGIGFTWEHPAHLYFKRAKSSELLFGDPTYHREQLAQRIGI